MFLVGILPTFASDENIDSVENINGMECARGQAIIMYKKKNFATPLKAKVQSVFGRYEIEDSLEFKNEDEIIVDIVKSDKYTTDELINKMKEKNWIISAEPNYKVKYNTDIDVDGINEEIEDRIENYEKPIKNEYNSDEIVVAVLDSGVDYTHTELKDRLWINDGSDSKLPGEGKCGYAFVSNSYGMSSSITDPMDDERAWNTCIWNSY